MSVPKNEIKPLFNKNHGKPILTEYSSSLNTKPFSPIDIDGLKILQENIRMARHDKLKNNIIKAKKSMNPQVG